MKLSIPNIHYDDQMKIIAKIIGKNKTVFDVACGTGQLAKYLNPSNKYSGVDLNKKFVNHAGPGIKEANIFDEKVYPKKADFIVISHTLHHIHPKEKELIILAKKHAKTVLVIEGIINTHSSQIWNNFANRFDKLFNFFGDADGINKESNIKHGLETNTEKKLSKIFKSLKGDVQPITGGILGIFKSNL